jgi:hypothetical protein
LFKHNSKEEPELICNLALSSLDIFVCVQSACLSDVRRAPKTIYSEVRVVSGWNPPKNKHCTHDLKLTELFSSMQPALVYIACQTTQKQNSKGEKNERKWDKNERNCVFGESLYPLISSC